MRIRQLRAKKITKPTNKYLNLKSFGNSFKQMNDLCRIAMVHANKEALSEDIVNRFQILFEIIDKLKQYGTTWQIIQQVLFDKNYTYEQSKQPYSRSSSQQLDFPQERKDNNPITRVILKQGHLHLIDFVRIHINLLALLYQYGEGKLSQEDLQNSLIEQIRQTNEENLEQSQNYLLIKPIRNIIEEDKQQSEVESEQSESEVKKLKVNQYSEQSLKNISHKFKKYLLELEFNPKNKQNSKKQEFKANTYQCELQKQKQKQKLQQLIIIKGKLSKSQQDQFTNSKLVEEKMQLQYQYQQHIQSRHLDKLITREPRQKKLEFKMGTFGFNRQLLELQNSTNTLIKKEQQQKDSDIRTLQKNKCEQISLSQLQKRKMLNLAKKNQIAEIKRYSIKLVKNKLISLNLKSNDDLSYKANSCKKQFKEINVQTANKGDLLKNKVFDLTVQSGNQLIKHQKLQKNPEYNCNQQKVYHIQYDLNYNNEEILKRRLEKNTQQRTLCQHISQINQELSNLNTFYLVEQQQQSLLKMQQCNKLLGGGCACSSQIKVETVNPVQRNGQYQIKQIIDGKEKLKKEFQVTSQSSTDAIKIGLGSYSDYNTNNIANNLQALWLKKIQLIVQLSNILQVKEYSDDIFNKIKNIASMIAQSSQFRYIKAQLLLYFAQILQLSSKNEYNEIMVSIVSNYLQEKQAAVKIIYKNNQIIADFIHQHLDKSQILIEISSFKNQITKHLDDKQQLEKINVSDAKIYFNYYDQLGNQGESNQFGVFKLEKITKQDIEDYLNKYKEQQQYENQEGFDEKQHKKLKELIFRNKQLTELLKLPINLYLTTRMITDLNLNDQSISNAFQEASDQVDIQELFFSQQFKKQSQNFIEQQKQLNLNNKEKQQLIEKVESCYFEYFQSIAMQMFIQKGSKFNFLSITRDSIQFQPREEVLTVFKQNQILVEDFLKKLKNYVDSRVITRIQLNFDAQDSVDKSKEKAPQQDQLKDNNEKQQEFEFRHKSLFEYFAARAMKYDFDLHKEEIYKLDISQLKQFNINKKIIMSNEKNASEFQILLKLFRLIKPQIDSQSFIQKITNQETSQTNRYIQFINNSQISKDTEKSQIDVGASNLLSALFFSKFSFPNLIFKKCSFSQAYIPSHSSKLAIFQDCNLSEALIEKYNLDKYETSNTKNAVFGGFQVQFDSQNIYSFQQVIFYKSTLISITENGFINQFEFQNNNKFCKLLSSKQITNSSLHSIHFVSSKNIFLVRATKSLFEIDAQTFETLNTFTFSFAISTLQINNLQYFVNLINNEIFHGDMQNGFSLLNTIQAQKCLSFDNYIITLQNKETIIQNLKNLEILKVMKDVDLNLTRSQFTPDGKYLLMISNSETLQIWSVEKEFELVKTIEGHTVFKMTFSEDGKYLATSSFSEPITCKIWSIENEFQLMQTIETGHKDLIHTLSFSADGKYVSTASFLDNFCQIWNIESGNNKLVNQIQGHTEYISTLTFSPDNKFLATCSKDETCRIWNTEKGFELIQTIETGHTQLISQASFSADSKYLATSSLEGNAKIWSVNQGFKLINTIQGHTDSISSIAFSTDGKYLATGSKDKTCKIWNILKGFELQTTIQGHTDSIKSVNFSVDNKYLFTGSKDHTCKIWNVNQGFELIQTIQGHTNSITCVASSRDGNYLATTSKDYSCKIWNIQKGFTLVNTIIEANAYMQQVAFSEDGKYLAIGQGDNTCQIWSVLKGFEKVNIIDGLDFAFITIAFSQNGKYLATGCRNSNFKVWNFEKGFDFINKIDTQHTSTINSVSFSSDGRYLVTGSQDNTYKIWSTEKGFDYLGQIEGHKNTILSVVFSEDSKYLATCSGDKTCKIWNVQKGFELIKTIEAHKDWVCSVAFSSNSKYLATGSWDKTCKIWNLERDFELVNNIEGHTNKIQSVAFSANNKYLATSSEDKTFKIWNPAKGFSLVVTIQQEKAEHLAFSVDSKYLVQGTNVWSVEKGFQFLKSIDGHTRISSIALSKNGKYLATTGSLYKTCKIWNIEKGFDLIYTFEEQSSFILSCGFSEDCKYLAIGLQDCTCKIWNIEKGLQDSYQIDQKIINENENKLNHQYIISKNIFYQAFQV
ncbi:hypothetical protein ABPG73_004658 [Tetrahymena malaccensis]